MTEYDCTSFHQYGSDTDDDLLIMFNAPAKELAGWAGIPRKGWRIRMLFQRHITNQRRNELIQFWETASNPNRDHGETYILGPTAITVAIQGEPLISDGKISLDYQSPIDFGAPEPENLTLLANIILPKVLHRLSNEQNQTVVDFEQDPFIQFPDIDHDYVFEFALQLLQMQSDAERFIADNDISEDELIDLITSMEAICRPAIVVDGQHRLYGASEATKEILLPVVAIPDTSWTNQIYQFVVINEKAQRVETSLLTDIFGSSLTKEEQDKVRRKLLRANVNIEARIAAVVANRDPESPFFNMVRVNLEGAPPPGIDPYLTDRTIRLLVDGGSGRNARGWRTDDEFYEKCLARQFPDRTDYDSWDDGAWRSYWFTFWHAIKDFYNDQANQSNYEGPMWDSSNQSNLTKAVTLRTLQSLFMTKCIDRVDAIEGTRDILIETLGAEEAETQLEKLYSERSIAADLGEFRDFVEEFFLESGIPIRVFTNRWVTSLDDTTGQQDLWDELDQAWTKCKAGERYHATGNIFARGGDGGG